MPLTVDRKTFASALKDQLERLRREIAALEKGELRHGIRRRDSSAWEDRTEEAMHDKRNLIATLDALLKALAKLK